MFIQNNQVKDVFIRQNPLPKRESLLCVFLIYGLLFILLMAINNIYTSVGVREISTSYLYYFILIFLLPMRVVKRSGKTAWTGPKGVPLQEPVRGTEPLKDC